MQPALQECIALRIWRSGFLLSHLYNEKVPSILFLCLPRIVRDWGLSAVLRILSSSMKVEHPTRFENKAQMNKPVLFLNPHYFIW